MNEIKIIVNDQPLIQTIDENTFSKVLGYADIQALQIDYPAEDVYKSFLLCILDKINT